MTQKIVKLKVATKKLGLGDNVGGHALRRLCGTTLNNAEGVSVEEALGSMRHGCVSAQLVPPYLHCA